DRGETIAKRLEVYQEQTNPLLAYYSEQKILHEIDGNRDSKLVFADIKKSLESFK
ncbi:MAG TPA: adenylate kinase, partial [Gelria sp.]|nr:adenylate kinase [Gelria sp.]